MSQMNPEPATAMQAVRRSAEAEDAGFEPTANASQMQSEVPESGSRVILLLGGGVESTLLLEQLVARECQVTPVHLLSGLWWEAAEAAFIRQFVAGYCSRGDGSRSDGSRSDDLGCVEPLIEFAVPLTGVIPGHWSVTGQGVPRSGEPAARLELPLRNLMLLGLALHQVRRRETQRPEDYQLVLGTTADNSFADGQRSYFDLCEPLLTREMGRPVRILTPLISLRKGDVIRMSNPRVLKASFSCVDPQQGQHCGRCIKCGSRQAAFQQAGVSDPTFYVQSPGSSGSPSVTGVGR